MWHHSFKSKQADLQTEADRQVIGGRWRSRCSRIKVWKIGLPPETNSSKPNAAVDDLDATDQLSKTAVGSPKVAETISDSRDARKYEIRIGQKPIAIRLYFFSHECPKAGQTYNMIQNG